MSRLMSRGAVLTASRLSNFGVLLITPLLLVRLLTVEAYGQYQEFMLYAMLLATVCAFSFDSSLTYFLPKYEDLERNVISQTTYLVLGLSSICVAALLVSRPLLLRMTSYDFVIPLAAFVFCFVNFNWLEYYWIAKRRTDLVLYYSAVRAIVRVSVVVTVAFLTRDVQSILWSLVAVEAFRVTIVTLGLLKFRLFTLSLQPPAMRERLSFSLPLGVSTLIQQFGRNIGKLFIANVMGPAALAFYAVGSYLVPIVRIVRLSIVEVVFPELVRARNDADVALILWQRTNIMLCVLLFPAFFILTIFAKLIVSTLFTEAYLPAVPVFQVYLIWLLRRCFNMDVLLRTRGKTGYVLIGTILVLAINVALMFALYRAFGLIGPAIAFITAEICLEIYYANRAARELGTRAVLLVDWRGLGRVTAGCAVGLPLLIAAKFATGPLVIPQVVAASLAYVAVSWWVAYRLGVQDIGRLARFVFSMPKRIWKRS